MQPEASPQPFNVNRRINLLAAAWAVGALAYAITYPFLPLYLHGQRGMAMSTVGLIFPIMGFARLVGPPIAGYLVDTIGRRGVLVAGPLVRAFVFFGLAGLAAINAPFWPIAFALFLAALMGTFFQNASDAYVTDLTSPDERPTAFSKIRMGLNVGWMIGPTLGAFLARTPFSLLFAITGVLCMATSLLVRKHCPEIKKHKPDDRKAGNNPSALQVLRRDRKFLSTMIFTFLVFLAISQLYSTFSVYVTERLAISKNGLGLLFTVNGLMVVLFQIPVSKALGKMSFNLRMVLGAILYAAGLFSVAFGHKWMHLFVSVVLITSGELLVMPTAAAMASSMAPRNMIGRYMGALGLVRGLGYALGPYLGALLFEDWSGRPVLYWGIFVSFALAGAGGFAVMYLREKNSILDESAT